MIDLGLHGYAKELCNELILTLDITLFNSLNLSFPYHVHRLVTLNRTPSGRVRSEA